MSRAFMIKQAPFKPTDIGGCQLWLDGADTTSTGITLSGTSVSSWNDKSGNAYNLTQGTSGSQPSYSANLITFSSNKYLNIPQAVMNNAATWSLFFVINPISSSNWIMVKQRDGQNTYNVLSMTINTNSGGGGQTGSTGFLYWRSFNAGSQAVSTAALTTSTLQICNLTYDGTNLYFYKNGVLEKTTTGTFAIQNDTNATNYTLGVWIQGGGFVNSGVTNFQFGELNFYSSFLNLTQRQQVEAYLAQKWGLRQQLPQGHPGTRGIVYPSQPIPTAIYWRYQSAFTPLSIGGCQMWLDAADATTITLNTTKVTQWNDKSVSGYNFTQGTSGNQPTYSTASQNTLNTITFTSANSTYLLGTASTTFMGTNSISVYGVFKINDTTSACCVFAKSLYGPGAGRIALAARDPGTPATLVSGVQGATTNAFVITSDTYTAGAWRTVGFVTDRLGFTTTAYQNGTSLGDVTISSDTTTNLTNSSSMLVGAYNSFSSGGLPPQGGYYLDGAVGELLVFNSALTTPQRQQIEGYLAWKWGLQANLPANHPYKNSSPITTNPAGISRPANVLPIPSIVCSAVNKIPSVPSGVITSGLVSFFTFDNTLADSKNTITLSQTGSVSYVTGRRNQAVYLANESNSANGTTATNYLTSSYNITVPFTVVVWFNPTNVTNGSLLSTYNSTAITNYSVNLYIQAAGGGMSAAYNAIQNVGAYTAVSIGTWYNAVITVNASNGLTLFVNGSQIGSTITQTPSINGLMIGNIRDNGGSYAYSGYLEDYRIYNRVLSGTEISQIYAGTG